MRAKQHHTKYFGDLGLIKVMADLTEKGWLCFLPVAEHLAVDLIAIKRRRDNTDRILRIQAKYNSGEELKRASNGIKYTNDDFDYYAIYLSTVNAVIYVKSDWTCSVFATSLRKGYTGFFWWKDFTKIKSKCPAKRTTVELGAIPTADTSRKPRYKIEWPNDTKLQRLILKYPLMRLAPILGGVRQRH